VRTLVSGDLAAGPHAYLWDGQDHGGRMAPSGIYLYRLITADQVLRGKMTLVE
jgi:flagellar hook assembly protein FlgD